MEDVAGGAVVAVVVVAMMLAGGISIMHNVLQGGTREDGTHVDETPQEAVDAGTPWMLVTIVLAIVGLALLAVLGEAV